MRALLVRRQKSAEILVSQAICSPPEPCHSKKSPLNIVYMININTSGPRLDIFQTSPWPQGQVLGEPGHLEPPRALPEQKVTNK